jgi:hypothetical protein
VRPAAQPFSGILRSVQCAHGPPFDPGGWSSHRCRHRWSTAVCRSWRSRSVRRRARYRAGLGVGIGLMQLWVMLELRWALVLAGLAWMNSPLLEMRTAHFAAVAVSGWVCVLFSRSLAVRSGIRGHRGHQLLVCYRRDPPRPCRRTLSCWLVLQPSQAVRCAMPSDLRRSGSAIARAVSSHASSSVRPPRPAGGHGDACPFPLAGRRPARSLPGGSQVGELWLGGVGFCEGQRSIAAPHRVVCVAHPMPGM